MSKVREEYEVLGMVLRNRDCLEQATGKLGFDSFSNDVTRSLFIQIVSDYTKHGVTGIQSMMNNVMNENEGKELMTAYTLTEGIDMPTFERAMGVLLRREKLRNLHRVAKAIEGATLKNEHPNDILEKAFEELWKLNDTSEGERAVIPADIGAEEFYEAFLERLENPDELLGIPLHYEDEKGNRRGFPFVYDYMNGLQGGDLIIIAGKTGTGKTGVGMNISRILSVEHGLRPYYLNTEMHNNQMYDRLVSATAQVAHMEVATSRLSGSPSDKDEKKRRILNAKERLGASKLITSVLPTLTSARIAQLAKQIKNMYGKVDVIIVDYVGRLEIEGTRRNMQTHDVMYEHAKFLKELARRIDTPIIALAQLNDDGKLEGAKKMANEADAVFWWEKVDPSNNEHMKRLEKAGIGPLDANFTMNIFKNRRGPGEGQYIHFDFAKSYQTIDQVDETRVMK